jgi:hypothetical protein
VPSCCRVLLSLLLKLLVWRAFSVPGTWGWGNILWHQSHTAILAVGVHSLVGPLLWEGKQQAIALCALLRCEAAASRWIKCAAQMLGSSKPLD